MMTPAPTGSAASPEDTMVLNPASEGLTGPEKETSANAASSLEPQNTDCSQKTGYCGRGRPKKTDVGQKTRQKKLNHADALQKQVVARAKKRKGGPLDEPWNNIAATNGGDCGCKKIKTEPVYAGPADGGDVVVVDAALLQTNLQNAAGTNLARTPAVEQGSDSYGNPHTERTDRARSFLEPGIQQTGHHIYANLYGHGSNEDEEDDKDAEGDTDWEQPIFRSHICHRCQERIGMGGKHSCQRAAGGTWSIQRKGYHPKELQAEWDEAMVQEERRWDMDLEAKRANLKQAGVEAARNDSGIRGCYSDKSNPKTERSQASTPWQRKIGPERRKTKRQGQTGADQRPTLDDDEVEDEYPFLSKLYDLPNLRNFCDRFVTAEISMPCSQIPTYPYLTQDQASEPSDGGLHSPDAAYGYTWSFTNEYDIANCTPTANITPLYPITTRTTFTGPYTNSSNANSLSYNTNVTPATLSGNANTTHPTTSRASSYASTNPTVWTSPASSGVNFNINASSPYSGASTSTVAGAYETASDQSLAWSYSSKIQDPCKWTDASYLKQYDAVLGGLPDWSRRGGQ